MNFLVCMYKSENIALSQPNFAGTHVLFFLLFFYKSRSKIITTKFAKNGNFLILFYDTRQLFLAIYGRI